MMLAASAGQGGMEENRGRRKDFSLLPFPSFSCFYSTYNLLDIKNSLKDKVNEDDTK